MENQRTVTDTKQLQKGECPGAAPHSTMDGVARPRSLRLHLLVEITAHRGRDRRGRRGGAGPRPGTGGTAGAWQGQAWTQAREGGAVKGDRDSPDVLG